MNTYNYTSPNTMWSMYLFNQTDPKKGAELLDENIIRPADAKSETLTISAKWFMTDGAASVGWATCCPCIIKTYLN